MTKNELRQVISEEGLIDYATLASDEAFELIPALLEELLQEAHDGFERLLQMPLESITFESFFEAFLVSDRHLGTLFQAVSSLNATHTSDKTRQVVTDFQPKLVDYHNKINLSRELYDRLKALGDQKLTQAQRRSLELAMRDMEVAGVHLAEEKRSRVEQINKRLSELAEAFSRNVTDARADFYQEINDESILSAMPASDLHAAEEEAKRRGSKAKYVFTLSQPSYTAIVRYCSDPGVREIFFKANHTLASSGKWDNRPLALEILKLRSEKAELLGFANYAEYVLQQRMASSVDEIESILSRVSQKASRAARRELDELRAYAGGADLKEWDLAYYSQKLKKEKFDVDDKIIRPYFPLEQVIEGLFALCAQLFGVRVKQVDRASYHPEVRVYQVFKGDHLLAYYLLDPFARPEKRGGAWADGLRSGYQLSNGHSLLPIVINACNFPKGVNGQPALLTHRDVETLFHEFGHALHLMLSSQTLPNLDGFDTEWDFVEMPSQIMENWCWEEDSLRLFAKHFETGEMIGHELIEKLKRTKTFMSGLFLTRQNEFGFLDLRLHTEPPPKTVDELDARAFEICGKYSALPKFQGYSLYSSFSHIFDGGYAAGYYSYVWAEVLEADIFDAIRKGGAMNLAMGQKFCDIILSQGTQKPAHQLFADFMGRDPQPESFFRKHGVE